MIFSLSLILLLHFNCLHLEAEGENLILINNLILSLSTSFIKKKIDPPPGEPQEHYLG